MDELSKLLGIAGGDDSLLSRYPSACSGCQYFKEEPDLDGKHRFWCEKESDRLLNITDKEEKMCE